MADIGTCRSCGASILWVEHAKSRQRMPVLPEPHPDGNVRVTRAAYEVLSKAEAAAARAAGEGLYLSHFADCPGRQTWKKGEGS